jgi:alpha-2-macroglobulin
VARALQKANQLFKEQHWAEARAAYDGTRELEKDWTAPPVRWAVEGAVACSLKLSQWDDALTRAQDFVGKTQGKFEEAVGERFLGGLYLSVPHYGTKRGTTYLRGQWTQGVQVYSWRKDSWEAVRHYERARALLLQFPAKTDELKQKVAAERIGVDFDLATALCGGGESGNGYRFGRWGRPFWWWWGEGLEAEEDSQAAEEADYQEPRWGWGGWGEEQTPPTGIPLGQEGKPQFIQPPKEYSPELGSGQKIRFLLAEVQQLDISTNKNDAARALFRWAMIARTLYGPDSASGYSSAQVRYDRFGQPLSAKPDPDEPKKKLWELADNETITIVGGKLRLITLPPSDNPLALLHAVEQEYPHSDLAPEAQYTLALYLQTRQQFPQAVEQYQVFLERYPNHKRAADAREQLRRIAQPDIMLSQSGVYLPDSRPKLAFSYRNTERVDFKALKFDLVKYVQDTLETTPTNSWWEYRNFHYAFFQNDRWKKYVGAEVQHWTESVQREPGNRTADGSTAAPLPEPGAYLVEATVAGKSEPSRVLVLVTDLALVQKNVPGKGMVYVCDARTGQPLPEKSVRFYEHWQVYNDRNHRSDLFWETTTATTDANGLVFFQRKHPNEGGQVDAVVTGEHGRMAFSFFQNWNETAYVEGEYWENGPRYYVLTDRPVYRPGATVQFRVWVRELQNRHYADVGTGAEAGPPNQPPGPVIDPATGLPVRPLEQSVDPTTGLPVGTPSVHTNYVQVELYDAKNTLVKSLSLPLDANNAASGDYTLGEEPPLGVWHLRINGSTPDVHHCAGGLFRVEEYKKPEFEVSVKPAKSQARLGEKVQAKIEARYYFGAPVAHATVAYKVFREDYHHVYWGPGEYDWLYGRGYGRCYYAYPWLPWWGRWGEFIWWEGGWPGAYAYGPGWWFPWGYYGEDSDPWRRRYESGTRKALRELVAKGEGKLAADGTFTLEIDTARAKAEQGDRDHRYTVEAEVRDESRRTIEGQGSVLATRQEFYAFVETDGGWYEPRREAFVEVRTLAPDNQPVAVQGQVFVKRISYGGVDHSVPQENVVTNWNAETDVQGRLSFRYPIPEEGQYRITFLTQDSAKAEVQGNVVFWVNGPKFDGRVYRFNDLEIIADKRTYKVGDTAHLLVNVAESDSRILFADQVSRGVLLNWRFIDLLARSTVIDLPIEARHVPNFFVEATLVRNGRLHTEARELFVPPVHGLLNVAVTTDKPVYQPGETGKVAVAVTDLGGKPVRGQVTLTAYDRAVTYIQDEYGPSPRVFFYGQKRQHTPYTSFSSDQSFQAWGRFEQPEWYVGQGGEPDSWHGWWPLEDFGLMVTGSGRWSGIKEESAFGGGSGGGGALFSRDSSFSVNRAIGAAAPMRALRKSVGRLDGLDEDKKAKNAESGARAMIEPEVRVDFADTAVWLPALTLDEQGKAQAEFRFPQSLTTWRVHGYALTPSTQVGDATNEVTTTKNLLVRLEAPRFFVERDEVVLSANVHNYLKRDKKVQAELILPADLFSPLDSRHSTLSSNTLHLVATATLKPNGEHRFDWPVRVKQAGMARITAKALTDEESDGMRLAFPVLVHGINKTIAQSGSYRVAQDGERSLSLDLPRDIDPEQTRLEVTLSPSLAGVLLDALPYLAGYPYGCVEQTMSRFYPSVLVKDTLKKMGTDLETIATKRKQMNPGDLENRFGRWRSPVFDSEELDRMVRAGLDRIYYLQRNDGGWGWWREDDSSPYQTAYVLQGLRAAREAGINVDSGVFERGLNYLQNSTEKELAKPKDQQQLGMLQCQVYAAYILALERRLQSDDLKKWFATIYEQRGELNNYGRALLALALQANEQKDEAKTVLRNLLQFVERDDSNETAWVRTPETYWWFWWNNDIEANAWALKALVTIDPQNDLAPRLVKWLLNNRRNGYYWRSTRDTALVIAAMTDFMRATGEAAPDYSLVVSVDGRPMKEVKLTKENFFTFDNQLLLSGLQLKPGPHKVALTKQGKGALYYSAYLSYFTKEEDVKGAGNEILVERQYFKLVSNPEVVVKPGFFRAAFGAGHPASQDKPATADGHKELRDTYTRVPLKSGDTVASGDKIEVVLKLTAKNTYDYLAFEDMKPAGCEPMELRSGGRWAGGLCANLELRDEKVVFFIGLLEQGQHVLRYKLRAETPGHFHALPAKGFAMYAPEVKGISDEMRLRVKE